MSFRSKTEQENLQNGIEDRFTRSSIPKRHHRERRVRSIFFFVSLLPVGLLLAIAAILVYHSYPIFKQYSLLSLITGSLWKPTKGLFGFLPYIAGTFWVTVLGVMMAVAPCLFTAIYLAEYARHTTRSIAKSLLDLLAGIPSVVYGLWGILTIVPFISNTLEPWFSKHFAGLPLFQSSNTTGYSILAGGIVLAVMITPFITSVVYEVLSIVPQGTREASLALGATRWHMVTRVVIPQVLPGIIAGIVLGASRALGETMAVLMVVGNVAQVPHSIFDAAYTLSALIANNFGEMMSIPLYDSALMSAALLLLVIILFFNILSTLVLKGIEKRA